VVTIRFYRRDGPFHGILIRGPARPQVAARRIDPPLFTRALSAPLAVRTRGRRRVRTV